MKKIRYSIGAKVSAVIFYEIFSVIFVISTILTVTLFDRGILSVDNFGKNSFVESVYYETLFEGVIHEIIEYAEYQNEFETNNVYDLQKKIDIMTYGKYDTHDTGEYLYSHRGLKIRYYLEDLEKWSHDFQQTQLESRNMLYLSETGKLMQRRQIYDNETLLSESVKEIKELRDIEENYGVFLSQKKEPKEDLIKDSELIQLLKEKNLLDISISTTFPAMDERYSTVDNSSILQKYMKGTISFEEMQEAYQYLYGTLESLAVDLQKYKRLVNKYEDDHSNVRFYITSEGNNQVCTNIFKKPESKQELLALGKKQGSYFYYNEKDMRIETSFVGLENQFYEQQSYWNYGYNTMIFVGVDQKFPAPDILQKEKKEYDLLQSFSVIGLIVIPVSFIGILLTLIFFSFAVGRHPDDEKIHFISFDKIRTEPLLLCLFFIIIISLWNFVQIWAIYDSGSTMDIMIMITSLFCISSGIFLLFYTALVKKIRAGVFWEHSILYRTVSLFQKIVSNKKLFLKNVFYLLMYGLFFLIILFLAIEYYENPTILLGIIGIFLIVSTMEFAAFFRENVYRNSLIQGIQKIAGGDLEHKIDLEHLKGNNRIIAKEINDIGTGLYHAVDSSVKNERMKADLIANVSHDIKTPLTSIVNYIHLLKRETLNNENAENYIRILDAKTQRLKQLTEDVVEISKITSGNIQLEMSPLNFVELVYQTAGEFDEEFEEKNLTAITRLPNDPVMILADGRRIWRVIENLYGNVAKYALENTRVYVDMEIRESEEGKRVVVFSIKNISAQPLNTDPQELVQRFTRGDVSRSTEGSGLGLAIAENLTKLMEGTFQIFLDGDLFKIQIIFPVLPEEES